MRRKTKLLYVGTNRFVLALDPRTGEEVWRTKLPHASGFSAVVTMLIQDDTLYVGSGGRAYALHRFTGEVQWHNGLPKTGYYPVLLAMEGAQGVDPAAAAAAATMQQQNARSSAPRATAAT